MLLREPDQAIDFAVKSRAVSQSVWWTHFLLAASFGLKGDIEEAKLALAEAIKVKPEGNSLARLRANRLWGSEKFFTLLDDTWTVGLRRAGLPEE